MCKSQKVESTSDLSHPVRLETYDGTCKVIIYHTSTVTKKVLVPKAHIVWVKIPSIHKMLSFAIQPVVVRYTGVYFVLFPEDVNQQSACERFMDIVSEWVVA